MPFRASVLCVLSLSEQERLEVVQCLELKLEQKSGTLWSQWRFCCALNKASVPDCLYLSRGEEALHISCEFESYGSWLKTFIDGKWHHSMARTCSPTLTRHETRWVANNNWCCLQQSTPFHTVFLNCIGLNSHISKSWLAMLTMQHWFQQSKKFTCSFPISQSPHEYLCTVPSPCSAPCPLPSQTRLGVGEAASLLPGKQLQNRHQPEWPPQQAVQMHPWCAGEAEHQMQGASWQVTGLQTSALVGMWQQHQTRQVQWQIREQLLSHWELTLPFASGNYNITHTFTQVLWPYRTIGLSLWGFPLEPNGVTGIKEFDKKTKNSWHCFSYFSSPETYMHHI